MKTLPYLYVEAIRPEDVPNDREIHRWHKAICAIGFRLNKKIKLLPGYKGYLTGCKGHDTG